jgi:hypothetical protein
MECKNLLVTKNNLIEHCDLSENADDVRVNVAITQAHNQLRAVICRDYYDYLIAQYNANTLAGIHLTLANTYIEPYLSWLSYSKYCLIGSQENTKSGFREQVSENSQPVTEARLNAIRKNAEEQALFHQGEMLYYLKQNITLFTVYADSDCYKCKSMESTFKITGAGGLSYYDRHYE